MSPGVRRTITAGMLWGGVVAVAGGIALTTDWLIKKDAEIGESQARQDSIVVALVRSDARLRRVEKVLRIKPGAPLPQIPQREGIARRLWRIVF